MRPLLAFTLALLCSITIHAQRSGNMNIGDAEATYDTLVHRHIAPGATYTQFQFDKIKAGQFAYKMKVHLVTIDITNPYNSFSPYLAKDEYHNVSKQHTDVKLKKSQGLKPVASITGGGFIQSNADLTTHTAYEVAGALVENGKILYENSKAKRTLYIDDKVHIGTPTFAGSVAYGSKTHAIGQINHHRDHYDGAGQISLFCNGIGKSLCSDAKASSGVDVKVRLRSKDYIGVGDTECEVIEVMDGCCHTMNQDEAILSGAGDAEAFLRGLKKGDDITISLGYKNEMGEKVDVQQQVTQLFQYGIYDGQIRPSDMSNYAICVVGCSEDGMTLYMGDLEISDSSNAPVQLLLEFLHEIGIYNVLSLDGGPSAEMTIDGEYVTTNSIGHGFNGRYIPAGLMLYSTAPNDDNISSIECTNNHALLLRKGDTFEPVVYGYNQYYEMIDNDARTSSAIEITCSESIGMMDEDGYTFIATSNGTGEITIRVKSTGYFITIPVTVTDNRQLNITPDFVFTGEGRECQVGVDMMVNGTRTPVKASDVEWSTNNGHVISSCEGGLIVPYIDGYAELYAEYAGLKDTILVYVENLDYDTDMLELAKDADASTMTGLHIPSVPYAFSIDLYSNVDDSICITYTTGTDTCQIGNDNARKGDVWQCYITLDREKISTYPVDICHVTGKGDITIQSLKAYYSITGDIDKDGRVGYTDLAELIAIYNRHDASLYSPIADLDKDGAITIADIVMLIDVILYK